MKTAQLDMDRQAVQIFIGEDHPEELKAAYERITRLEADLNECLEYFEDKADVNDGDYGEPSPNKEMRLASMLDETLNGSPF